MDAAAKEKDYDMDLGLYEGIPEKAYHSSPGISKHGLDLINKSPAHYKQFVIEESAPLIFGAAFHCLILEPDLFPDKYLLSPYSDFRTKEARQWKAQLADGVRVISKADYDLMHRMAEAIKAHPYASILLDHSQGKAEMSGYWVDSKKEIWRGEKPTYRLCRCRVDFLNQAHDIAIDLKTAINAGYSAFARDAVKYRYHVQDAFYTDGLRQCNQRVSTFVFIVIEKVPPFNIGVYELSKDDRQFGRELYQRDLLVYDKCMKEKQWPGYPDEVRVIELPPYSRYVDIS